VSPLPHTPPDDADATVTGSPAETAAPPDSRVTQWRGRVFTSTSPVWIFLALIVIVAVFGVMKPHEFLSSFDIKTIFINASVALMLSVGMTFVIITAGIDLSVGSVLVFSGVLAAKVMIAVGGGSLHATTAGWGAIALGLAVGLVTGLGWGAINGALIAFLGIPPLIVTLGTFGMALGLADVITGGVDVSGIPAKLNMTIGAGSLGPIPVLVVVAVVVTVVLGLVLHLTRFGRYTYAIGSNAEAVRRAGINVNWHLIKVYALAGLLAIPAVLLARFVSVGASFGVLRIVRRPVRGTIAILTWGGLRGGLAIALALAIPPGPQRSELLAITYIVVVFSIMVQGLSMEKLLKHFHATAPARSV